MSLAASNSVSVKRGNISKRSGRPLRRREAANPLPVPIVAENTASGDLPLSGRRILLIDDNVGIATLITGLLQDAGATVDVSRSADAAVAQAIRRVPALAVIHLPLPKDAALALSQRLKGQTALAGLRTIILSGEEGSAIEAADAADAVHPRPISPQRLLDDVARLLLMARTVRDDQPGS